MPATRAELIATLRQFRPHGPGGPPSDDEVVPLGLAVRLLALPVPADPGEHGGAGAAARAAVRKALEEELGRVIVSPEVWYTLQTLHAGANRGNNP